MSSGDIHTIMALGSLNPNILSQVETETGVSVLEEWINNNHQDVKSFQILMGSDPEISLYSPLTRLLMSRKHIEILRDENDEVMEVKMDENRIEFVKTIVKHINFGVTDFCRFIEVCFFVYFIYFGCGLYYFLV